MVFRAFFIRVANPEHLAILKQGVEAWNKWWKDPPSAPYPGLRPFGARADLKGVNLRCAQLRGADLYEANLNEADLSGADLRGAWLTHADLRGANLNETLLIGAQLDHADLSRASLCRANLNLANLSGANLQHADLSSANLFGTVLVEAKCDDAILNGCWVYGVAAWNISLTNAQQDNLVITRNKEPAITVENLEIAQFIYLLLSNERVRHVIDTITSKVVLILGRFTAERKTVLDALRNRLRQRNYVPVLVDFDKPTTRDITETVRTLASMSRFVIADITEAKSIPQELMAIVPDLPSVPVQPLMLASQQEYSMFEHFTRYPWVLPIYFYTDQEVLLRSLDTTVIAPAMKRAKELQS